MSIRWSKGVGSESGVESGYNKPDASLDYNIQSCDIVDVDRALFNLFDKEIGVNSNTDEHGKIAGNAPVIFGTGERWALAKKGVPRDKTGAAILPIITIRRNSIVQDYKYDIAGRGMSQQTGELYVKRRLSERDRSYQNLIDKTKIENTDYSAASDKIDSQLRLKENHKNDISVQQGSLIDSGLTTRFVNDNVWEFIVIPAPQFYTSKFTVMFWCQYMRQLNSMVQKTITAMLPQGKSFKLETDKGYWFLANIVNDFTIEDNIEDMLGNERILKCSFDIEVPGYIVASREPGSPSPVRRHVSAPFVSFEVVSEQTVNVLPDDNATNRIDHSSDPSIGHLLLGDIASRDDDNRTIKKPEFGYIDMVNQRTNKRERVPTRVIARNSKGETVVRPIDRYLGATLETIKKI